MYTDIMAENQEKVDVYKVPTIHEPSVKDLASIAQNNGLHFRDGELEELQGYISQTLVRRYQTVNDLIAPTLPVRYPRTPGYRPEPEDNLCNAWYWKCDIKGAAEGILKGKTVGVKDNKCVAGVPMMNGSRVMEGFVPDIDATVITKVLDAGGRIIGKTNCEHLCYGGTSWTNDTGPALNPHDKFRVSGGSSSGCAVAVCNGEVHVAIGADQGGSIRSPASWCGVVGLKPTWGLVPYTGAVAMEITIDHFGPMARNAYDCALLLEVMAGYDDGLDPRQPRDLQVPEYTDYLDGNIEGWKIGLLSEGFTGCDDDVQAVVRGAAETLGKAGAVVEDVSIPLHTHGVGHHYKGYYAESMMTKLSQGYKMDARHLSEPVKSAVLFAEYIEKNTAPFDSTGHPAITVNAGKSNGLPVGMMIVGKRFEDFKVLQAAYALDKLQLQN